MLRNPRALRLMRAGRLVINKYLLTLNPLVINFQIECFNTLCLQEGRREIINWIDNNYGMLGTKYILTDLVCIRTLSILSMLTNVYCFTQQDLGEILIRQWWLRLFISFKLMT